MCTLCIWLAKGMRRPWIQAPWPYYRISHLTLSKFKFTSVRTENSVKLLYLEQSESYLVYSFILWAKDECIILITCNCSRKIRENAFKTSNKPLYLRAPRLFPTYIQHSDKVPFCTSVEVKFQNFITLFSCYIFLYRWILQRG